MAIELEVDGRMGLQYRLGYKHVGTNANANANTDTG